LTHYKLNDLLEVKIEKIIPNGFGLAFAEGLTVFVSLAAPGDRLRVAIRELRKKIAFAEIVDVIEPSPVRIAPPCKYFGTCGGCDFQQMSYQAQLEAKVAIIRDCLRRIGKIDLAEEIPIVPSPRELEYRSRAQWHIDTRAEKFGYFRRNSHEVVDIEQCPILTPEMNSTLSGLRNEMPWEKFWDETAGIEAAEGDSGRVSLFSAELSPDPNDISCQAAGETYYYSARSFFQGNRSLIEPLIETATKNLSGGTALDLYCGVGLFTLRLARKFERVIGIEENETAVQFAKKNSAKAGLDNIEFIRKGVDAFLVEERYGDVDLVLLDPPRAGAELRTIDRIAALRPKQISYVSCEPSILARDLRILSARGYSISSITAFDLFPQTHHVETVARLER
jgi:tRNA/tmRNA/rRNA uracil-C5-methylase (TrmA/RlmC/RlmD family)